MLKDNRRINQDLLKQAIKLNDMQLFEHLLERDNSLADDKFGKILNKPLHFACEYGRLEMVVQLLDTYMVELNAVCPLTGFTPLMYAVQANQAEAELPFIMPAVDCLLIATKKPASEKLLPKILYVTDVGLYQGYLHRLNPWPRISGIDANQFGPKVSLNIVLLLRTEIKPENDLRMHFIFSYKSESEIYITQCKDLGLKLELRVCSVVGMPCKWLKRLSMGRSVRYCRDI